MSPITNNEYKMMIMCTIYASSKEEAEQVAGSFEIDPNSVFLQETMALSVEHCDVPDSVEIKVDSVEILPEDPV
jgi:hypothetical protein